MGFHGISWDFMGFHGISWDFMGFQHVSVGSFLCQMNHIAELHWLFSAGEVERVRPFI